MINELFERELRNTSINDVSLADYVKENYIAKKSGKWIELPKALNPNENPCKCSECGHILSFMNCYPKSNYCPNCGAKMESGDKE